MVRFLGCPVQGQDLDLMILIHPSNSAYSIITFKNQGRLAVLENCTSQAKLLRKKIIFSD